MGDALAAVEELMAEGQVLAAAVNAKFGVPSPLGLAPSYPGLQGPVIAVLRAANLRATAMHWKLLRRA